MVVSSRRFVLIVTSETITYRQMKAEDILDASNLVVSVFNKFVAPEYSAEGVQEFYRYIEPTAFQERAQANHFGLIALVQTKVVGMIEIRGYKHVSLLFVDQGYQRRGIAKELLFQALQICQTYEPQLSEISVNSSSFAVPIYEKLGFYRVGERQVRNGIGFVPMVLKLLHQNGD
jgi:predicted GNAT family N-acyltransferase